MNEVLPTCVVPSCREAPATKFLGFTQLCPRHASRAHGRAATNVLIFGVGFITFGAAAMISSQPWRPVFIVGVSLAGAGLSLTALMPYFSRAAKRYGA